jgi:hypothetical protein
VGSLAGLVGLSRINFYHKVTEGCLVHKVSLSFEMLSQYGFKRLFASTRLLFARVLRRVGELHHPDCQDY